MQSKGLPCLHGRTLKLDMTTGAKQKIEAAHLLLHLPSPF